MGLYVIQVINSVGSSFGEGVIARFYYFKHLLLRCFIQEGDVSPI